MKKFTTLATIIISTLIPSFAFANFDQSLSYGMMNQKVETLQEFLTTQNCFTITPTGYFGLITLQAVKCFQANNELPVTGYFGVMSRSAADAIIEVMTASSTEAQTTEQGSQTIPNPSSGSIVPISTITTVTEPITTYIPVQSSNIPLSAGSPSEVIYSFATGAPYCNESDYPYLNSHTQVVPVSISGPWSSGTIIIGRVRDGIQYPAAKYSFTNSLNEQNILNYHSQYAIFNWTAGDYYYIATLNGNPFTGTFTIGSCQ